MKGGVFACGENSSPRRLQTSLTRFGSKPNPRTLCVPCSALPPSAPNKKGIPKALCSKGQFLKFSKICEPTDRRTENAFRSLSSMCIVRKVKKPSSGRKVARNSVTEGARVTLNLDILHCNAFSLSRLRRQLARWSCKLYPHRREPFLFIYNLSIFLTSTAFVSTNAKYGIPLSRYTVFLQNCPLE